MYLFNITPLLVESYSNSDYNAVFLEHEYEEFTKLIMAKHYQSNDMYNEIKCVENILGYSLISDDTSKLYTISKLTFSKMVIAFLLSKVTIWNEEDLRLYDELAESDKKMVSVLLGDRFDLEYNKKTAYCLKIALDETLTLLKQVSHLFDSQGILQPSKTYMINILPNDAFHLKGWSKDNNRQFEYDSDALKKSLQDNLNKVQDIDYDYLNSIVNDVNQFNQDGLNSTLIQHCMICYLKEYYFLEYEKYFAKGNLTRSQNENKKPQFKIDQIALKYAYESIQITRENGNEIAKEYGHNSGEKLFQRYTYYSSAANRKGRPNPCTSRKLDNKIKLIESIIDLLPEGKKERAIDEVLILKKIYDADY